MAWQQQQWQQQQHQQQWQHQPHSTAFNASGYASGSYSPYAGDGYATPHTHYNPSTYWGVPPSVPQAPSWMPTTPAAAQSPWQQWQQQGQQQQMPSFAPSPFAQPRPHTVFTSTPEV